MSGWDLKKQYSLDELRIIMDTLHSKVLSQLFRQDPKTAPDSADFNNSFDSTDSQESLKSSWIVDRFIDQYKLCADKFTITKKLKSLMDEFMDHLETDYFDSLLLDLIDTSYS